MAIFDDSRILLNKRERISIKHSLSTKGNLFIFILFLLITIYHSIIRFFRKKKNIQND